jgi:glycosyltransferase involved in cell wall biosynthesis
MKSVCQVVQNVYDIDPRVRRKAEALVAAGYSVDVLALRAAGSQKDYTLNGVNVRTLSLGKKRGSIARYFFEYAVFFVWVFIRVPMGMLNKQYSVIDVNSLPDFLIFAPLMARWMGAKLVLDLHEITPEFYMSKYGIPEKSWTIWLLTYLENISVKFADRVITINAPIEDLLVGRGLDRSKSTVIMNAVDEARFAANSCASSGLARRDSKKFVMMYHGTLTSIYGLDIAIEALALVHHDMPGAELWILGSGSEKDALARLAEERGVSSKVRLVGQVPATEIPGWLSQCDAGILPIRRDVFLDFAFPNKLPEFIIAGKVVIVSRLKAIRHYFSEEALAYFEPNNPADLAKQMLRIYEYPRLRDRLVLHAREEYVPVCWDVMKQRYVTLINEMVDTGRGTAEPLPAIETSMSGKVTRPSIQSERHLKIWSQSSSFDNRSTNGCTR